MEVTSDFPAITLGVFFILTALFPNCIFIDFFKRSLFNAFQEHYDKHFFSLLCIVLTESFLQGLHRSLGEDTEDEAPLQASTDWVTRKSLLSGWWAKKRWWLKTMVAWQHAASQVCQQCGNSPAVIRCSDCQSQAFLCGQCDIKIHQCQVFHNRDMMTHIFFFSLPQRVLSRGFKPIVVSCAFESHILRRCQVHLV